MGPTLRRPRQEHPDTFLLPRPSSRSHLHSSRTPEDVLLYLQHYSAVRYVVNTDVVDVLVAADVWGENNSWFVGFSGVLDVYAIDRRGSTSNFGGSATHRYINNVYLAFDKRSVLFVLKSDKVKKKAYERAKPKGNSSPLVNEPPHGKKQQSA